MTQFRPLLLRLFPAALITALFCGVAFVVFGAIMSGASILEFLYLGLLMFIMSFVVGLVGGIVLLAIVSIFRMHRYVALVFFLIAVQVIAGFIQIYVLSIKPPSLSSIEWKLSLISAPASIIAWYQSVYYVWKQKEQKIA